MLFLNKCLFYYREKNPFTEKKTSWWSRFWTNFKQLTKNVIIKPQIVKFLSFRKTFEFSKLHFLSLIKTNFEGGKCHRAIKGNELFKSMKNPEIIVSYGFHQKNPALWNASALFDIFSRLSSSDWQPSQSRWTCQETQPPFGESIILDGCQVFPTGLHQRARVFEIISAGRF